MSDEVNRRIIIDRGSQALPPSGQGTAKREAAAKERNEAAADAIRSRRREIHNQARHDAAQEPDQEPLIDAPPREDIEEIYFTLRDGREIVYGPPRGISTTDRIVRMYAARAYEQGGPNPSMGEQRLTKILLGVRSIAGRPVPPVTDLVQRTRLANELGDEALDILFYYHAENWPDLSQKELPLIKKQYRTQTSGS